MAKNAFGEVEFGYTPFGGREYAVSFSATMSSFSGDVVLEMAPRNLREVFSNEFGSAEFGAQPFGGRVFLVEFGATMASFSGVAGFVNSILHSFSASMGQFAATLGRVLGSQQHRGSRFIVRAEQRSFPVTLDNPNRWE